MYLLFDIGGTKTRLAISPDGKTFENPMIINTHHDFDQGIEDIRNNVFAMKQGLRLKAAFGGIAGILDNQRTTLFKAPHLPNWSEQFLRDRLEDALECPIYLENDSALVGLGEAIYGAGKGASIMAYLTISTGVGGVRIVNGRIDCSAYGFEPGHQIINFSDFEFPKVFKPRELESYISGSALQHLYDKDPAEIHDPQVWAEVEKLLAVGIHNTILYWSPAVIVLGGGLIKNISTEEVMRHLKKTLKLFPELPEIKKATLENLGGLYGALEYLKQTEH